jgi:ABC-type cobalamin transport system ATPase subunit
MDRGGILAAGHAQEIFEDVRLDAACGARFERLKVGRHALLRRA